MASVQHRDAVIVWPKDKRVSSNNSEHFNYQDDRETFKRLKLQLAEDEQMKNYIAQG